MGYNGQPEFKNGKPKVVLSFGAKDSALFAQWLYWTIKTEKHYTERNNVYLDTIAMQAENDTQLTILPMINGTGGMGVKYGKGIVGWTEGLLGGLLPGSELPKKVEQVPQNYTKGGVASFNDHWDDFYGTAVQACAVMIFVVTPEWLNSRPCFHELEQFGEEVAFRGGTPIRGIALTFENDKDFPPSTWARFKNLVGMTSRGGAILNRMEQLPCRRRWSFSPSQRKKIQGMQRDLWLLEDASLQRLLNKLPS